MAEKILKPQVLLARGFFQPIGLDDGCPTTLLLSHSWFLHSSKCITLITYVQNKSHMIWKFEVSKPF